MTSVHLRRANGRFGLDVCSPTRRSAVSSVSNRRQPGFAHPRGRSLSNQPHGVHRELRCSGRDRSQEWVPTPDNVVPLFNASLHQCRETGTAKELLCVRYLSSTLRTSRRDRFFVQ